MPEDVKAQITGNVWKIVVKQGDEVEEGDDLIILESMKMEIPVEAPFDGTVVELLVNEGDNVDEDQVLCRIEEE